MGWRYRDASGRLLGESHRFEDARSAEAWMAEAWSDLRAQGIEEVELVDVDLDETSYRMSLSEYE
jgi:hypothetical protein